jgi:cytosine/creatinine deaminase
MFAQMTSTLLRRARIVHADVTNESSAPELAVVDVRIVDGHIAAVGTLTPEPDDPDEMVVELDGYLLLPAAIEPHAHLDKAFLAERVANPTGDLMGAIEAMSASRHLITVDDIVERAERAARLMAHNGYVAVRTHADLTMDNGLTSIEALSVVRSRLRDVIDIEIVALSGWPVSGPDGADQRALVRAAIGAGADLVGGCPHLEDAGTRAATDVLLELATELGVGVDLHTDETLDPSADGLSDLCRSVLDGFSLPVTASHCVSLGQRNEADQRMVAELVAATGVSVIALPHTNLFLQGRFRAPMPRGLTAITALRAAGVNVAAGADNLQDPFNPLGRACPFETAGLMMLTAHLLPDEAWHTVSAAGAQVVGRTAAHIAAGSPADLVAIRADGLRDAIAWASGDRLAWRHGHLIGETES